MKLIFRSSVLFFSIILKGAMLCASPCIDDLSPMSAESLVSAYLNAQTQFQRQHAEGQISGPVLNHVRRELQLKEHQLRRELGPREFEEIYQLLLQNSSDTASEDENLIPSNIFGTNDRYKIDIFRYVPKYIFSNDIPNVMSSSLVLEKNQILIGTHNSKVYVWDLSTNTSVESHNGPNNFSIIGIMYDKVKDAIQVILEPNSKSSVDNNGAWSYMIGRCQGPRYRMMTHSLKYSDILSMRILNRNPNSKYVFTSVNLDRTLQIRHAHNGKFFANLFGHTAKIRSAELNHSKTKAVSAGDDRTVRLWNLIGTATDRIQRWVYKEITEHRVLYTGDLRLNSASFSPDDRYVVIGGESGLLGIIDTLDPDLSFQQFDAPNVHFESVTYSQNGQFILTTSNDNIVRVWSSSTMQLINEIDLRNNGLLKPNEGLISAKISEDGSMITTLSSHGHLVLWELKSLIDLMRTKGLNP